MTTKTIADEFAKVIYDTIVSKPIRTPMMEIRGKADSRDLGPALMILCKDPDDLEPEEREYGPEGY